MNFFCVKNKDHSLEMVSALRQNQQEIFMKGYSGMVLTRMIPKKLVTKLFLEGPRENSMVYRTWQLQKRDPMVDPTVDSFHHLGESIMTIAMMMTN
jgi:hypothetical protein